MNNRTPLFGIQWNEPLSFWQTTWILTWILIKLVLVASMMNLGPGEFIYAGF